MSTYRPQLQHLAIYGKSGSSRLDGFSMPTVLLAKSNETSLGLSSFEWFGAADYMKTMISHHYNMFTYVFLLKGFP